MSSESVFSRPFCAWFTSVTSKDELIQAPGAELQLGDRDAAVHAFNSEQPFINSCLLAQSWSPNKASRIWPTVCSILKAHSWDCQHKQTLAVFNSDRDALLHMLWDCPNPWQKIKCQCLSNQRFRNSTFVYFRSSDCTPKDSYSTRRWLFWGWFIAKREILIK